MSLPDRVYTKILESLLYTVNKIWNHRTHRTLIAHSTRNTLCDLQMSRFAQISRIASLLHCIKASHTSILLHTYTVLVEVMARCLGTTRKHRTTHGDTASQGQCFHDVPTVLNATVCNDWNIKLLSDLADLVHRRCLTPTNCADFLRRTDTTRAHTNAKAVSTGFQ